MKQLKYYTLKNILSKNAHYNVIFGERSNGKTYSVLKHGIEKYTSGKGQLAVIRRWQDDFRGKRGATYFEAIIKNGEIKKLTNGEWDDVVYMGARWYFAKWDDKLKKKIMAEEPFAYAFALSAMEHDKSASFPDITTILFDEFLTRNSYLVDEFVLFMNVLSTIIRQRVGVEIFMCGNTVNQYCPYFREMGLVNVKNMNKGDIDVYTYGESGLLVAVEYADMPSKSKPSDIYFAFNNPKLNMIKGGAWEIDIYPHCPFKYSLKNIRFTYFIIFDNEMLQCEIVNVNNTIFTFIHRKTSPLKYEDKDLIFSQDFNPRPNWRRKVNKPFDELGKKIYMFYIKEKIFYQDNEVGEIVRNYLNWCNTEA